VCTFTVAVNRKQSAQQRQNGQQPEADFFRVTAWRQLGEICGKFLQKGKKVAVVGSVSVSTFTGNDGATRASLEVTAEDVEMLSPRVSDAAQEVPQEPARDAQTGYEQVQIETDELPF
jgi:single-strand DNA-binding protein